MKMHTSSYIYPFLLAVSLILSACNSSLDLTPAEHISRAKDYQDKGDLKAATIELKSAIQRDSNNAEARWLLGEIYLEAGDGATAEKELRHAVDLGVSADTVVVALLKAELLQGNYQEVTASKISAEGLSPEKNAEILALKGNAEAALNRLDKAAELYDAALRSYADSKDAALGKAMLASRQNHLEDARKQLDQVLQKYPDFAPAWSLLGDIQGYEGKVAEAEKAYNKAIDLRVNNSADRLKRALLRIAQKDYKGASDDISQIRKNSGDNVGANYAQGVLDLQQSKFADAQTAFEKTLSANPDYMPAVFYLGVTHFLQGHDSQANKQLSQYVSRIPNYEPARQILALTRLRVKDYRGAEEAAKPVLQRKPDDTLTLKIMGQIAMARGDTADAIEYLQKAVSQDPNSAKTRANLGLNLMIEGNQQQFSQELEKAINLEPSLPQADMLLILGQLRAHKKDEALATAQRFLEKQPKEALPLNLLGIVHLAREEDNQARKQFEQALSLSPGDPAAAHNLAVIELKAKHVDKARALYKEVLNHHPGHLRSLIKLSEMEDHTGSPDRADNWLTEAIKANPQALEPRIRLARRYLGRNAPKDALSLLNDVKDNYATHPALLTITGEAQLASKQETSAVLTFQKLVNVLPKSPDAHYLLAEAYAATGDAVKTAQQLDAALKLNPKHFQAKVSRMRLLIWEKKSDAADKLLVELKQTFPRHPEVLVLEGQLALLRAQPQQAIKLLSQAQTQAPSGMIAIELFRAQLQAGRQQEALRTLEDWLRDHPQDMQVRTALAEAYLGLDKPKAAIAAFTKIVEQTPDNVPALNNLAWLLRNSDPKMAQKYAEKAAKLAPNSPAVMDTLGQLMLDQGNTERALQLFQQISDTAPHYLTARYHLAVALHRAGEKDKAKTTLKALLADNTPFPEQVEAKNLLKTLQN